MDKLTIELILRIILLIALLSFGVIFITTEKTHCDACKYEEKSFSSFLNEYTNECLVDKFSTFKILTNPLGNFVHDS